MSLIKKEPSNILRKQRPSQPANPDQDAVQDDMLAGFRARDREMRARFAQMNDTECWVAICFNTREDKDRFIEAFGLAGCPLIPGTAGDKYVDGYALVDSWLDEQGELPEQ